MGTEFFATINSGVIELSIRAIVGASLALFMLFVITALFRQNEELKKLLFLLIVAVVVFASTILIATAMLHLQDYAFIQKVVLA